MGAVAVKLLFICLKGHTIQYLKSSKRQKDALRVEQPFFKRFGHLGQITWPNKLPTQYLFYLLCCYNCTAQGCLQPICQKERTETPTWFNGGPPILCLPLPIPDSSRPWGSQCSECKGSCYGHFLQPAEVLQSTLQPMLEPPQKVAETHRGRYIIHRT